MKNANLRYLRVFNLRNLWETEFPLDIYQPQILPFLNVPARFPRYLSVVKEMEQRSRSHLKNQSL